MPTDVHLAPYPVPAYDSSMSTDPKTPFFVESASDMTRVDDGDLLPHLSLLRRPAVIDAAAFKSAFAALGSDPDPYAGLTAVLLSRIRFQGTDGMRGRVASDCGGNPIEQFVSAHEITPAFVELSCLSFGRMLIDAGITKEGDWVLIGEDGRDLYGGDNLYRAACIGLGKAGLSVMSMGMCPTPEVPFQMLNLAVRAGVMLTASHNPSDQNGLKFFIDGAKLLPEDGCGDYVLSAYMAALSSETSATDEMEMNIAEVSGEARAVFAESIISSLPDMSGEKMFVVLDAANGAFSVAGPLVLDKLGIQCEVINCDPLGTNINQDGGAAALGDALYFDGDVAKEIFDEYLSPVKRVFEEGRAREGRVFGISLDGDGDRGYVLAYEKAKDRVNILNGDVSAFIIARMLKDQSEERDVFCTTVESDLMTNYYAESQLGLKTVTMCVGDKWISRSDDPAMLVGAERTGHVIIPTEVNRVRLRTGNGLLAGLYTIAGIFSLELSDSQAANPYPAGALDTWCTYNTDQSRFCRDSSIWKEDRRIIEQGLQGRLDDGVLPGSSRYELDLRMEEPGMLLYRVWDSADMPIASIFVRNSGTEAKTTVYLRTSTGLLKELSPICQCLNENHLENMKDEGRPEFGVEQAVLSVLKERCRSTTELVSMIDDDMSSLLESVLYGLRMEHRITVSGDTVSLVG